jgi:hypothetical protein
MSRLPASATRRGVDIDELGSAVADIASELHDLGIRVRELTEAIESMASDQSGSNGAEARPAARPASTRTVYEETRVTVRPLPELAMAAVAETSLRGLPGVKQVVSVERVEDWATFVLEVSTDIDLISEMRAAMPVGFTVTESKPNDISLELKWLWGTGSA